MLLSTVEEYTFFSLKTFFAVNIRTHNDIVYNGKQLSSHDKFPCKLQTLLAEVITDG